MRVGGGREKKLKIKININKPPCHLERNHSRVLHTKSGEDPTKTEGEVGVLVIQPEFAKNAKKNSKSKYQQSPCRIVRDNP